MLSNTTIFYRKKEIKKRLININSKQVILSVSRYSSYSNYFIKYVKNLVAAEIPLDMIEDDFSRSHKTMWYMAYKVFLQQRKRRNKDCLFSPYSLSSFSNDANYINFLNNNLQNC